MHKCSLFLCIAVIGSALLFAAPQVHISSLSGIGPQEPHLFWLDQNTSDLMRGKLRTGHMIVELTTISENFPASQVIATDHNTLYWLDKETGVLKRSLIRDGKIADTITLGTKEKVAVTKLTGAGQSTPQLLWTDDTLLLRKAIVEGNDLLPSKGISPKALPAVAIAFTDIHSSIYWVERGGTQLLGARLEDNEMQETKVIAENFNATTLAAVGHKVYWVDGNTQQLKVALERDGKLVHEQIVEILP